MFDTVQCFNYASSPIKSDSPISLAREDGFDSPDIDKINFAWISESKKS